MYPNALQIEAIPLRQMDNATVLSFVHMVDNHGQANATMQTKMGQFWTDFHAAYVQLDLVINPARKSLQTEDLVALDSERDNSLGSFHEALLGLQRHPVAEKRLAARQLLLNYDTFAPERSQEYMKETELIKQMIDELENRSELVAAVTLLGLGDYVTDLKTRNEEFAAVMASRTASTEGVSKGVVAAARTDLEQKYQLFRRMLNVASIYEGDTDYRPFILSVNAEVEHYKDILARKGGGSSSGSSSNNGNNGSNGSNENNGGGSEQGGGSQQGGSEEGGSGSGDDLGTTPPSGGGGFPGSDEVDDQGGGSGDSGGTDVPPSGGGGFGG